MRTSAPTLSGKKIWVTRPAHQADDLCRMIEERQGAPLRLPTLVIRPVPGEQLTAANRQRLAHADIAIFISKNAVVHSVEQFPHVVDVLREKAVLAVGRATAGALLALGLKPVGHIDTGGSESLLQLALLSGTEIRDKRVLIIRGQGGREVLRDSLLARGAGVDYLEVYRRDKPDISQADMAEFWHDERPDAVVITSLAGLDNLVELMPDGDLGRLYETAMVVMSERIRQRALEAGFLRVAVATENSDTGLVDALMNMNEGN